MAVGNLFILGLFVPAAAVGYYAGADKIAKPAGSLGEPITNALFPRLSLMIHENPERAIRLVRLSLMATVALGATLTLLIFFAAPLLIRIFMGAEYPEAVEIMRVLAWLPLLLAPIGAIGTQWMLPLHLDRYLNAVIAITTGINLVLALLLIPRFGGIGMAWSVIIYKLLELSGFTLVLIWLRVHPLRLSLDNLKGVLARRAFHEN
jgi:PST family polysaccharide transporter